MNENDQKISNETIATLDMMLEMLHDVVERAINLKNQIEDLRCIVEDFNGNPTNDTLQDIQLTLKRSHELYNKLF